MWILAQKQKEAVGVPKIGEVNYYELSNEKRLEILLSTLSDNYEIYFREYDKNVEEIMIYCQEYKDFIHEDGFRECNLILFWEEHVIEMIEEIHRNQRLSPAS